MRSYLFQNPDHVALDRRYLRLMAIRRLLRHGHITWGQAFEIADRRIRGYYNPGCNGLMGVLNIWKRNGFPEKPESMTLSERARPEAA